MVAINNEVDSLLEQVKSWPPEWRIALARKVLETLEAPLSSLQNGRRGPSSAQVLGLWNPGGAAPTDAECEQILIDELERKHSP